MQGKEVVMVVTAYLFAARRAAMDPATSKDQWLVLIREGQELPLPELVWTNLCAMVQLAIVGGHGTKLKEVALDLYEADALAGDHQACELLYNFGRMAGDEELLARFTMTLGRSVALDRSDPAEIAQLHHDMRELGIDPETMVVAGGVRLEAPRWVYTK